MIDYLVGQVPLPDFVLRTGVKYLLSGKKKEIGNEYKNKEEQLLSFAEDLKKMPIAIFTEKANEQHYEVPAEFYELVLGSAYKYSCGSWDRAKNLDESEVEMLESYIEKGQFVDGQKVLDLGCGWGSFTLYAAEKFPNSSFVAISNSSSQKAFIMDKANAKGLKNVKVITENIANFEQDADQYDRIISIEMLEHVKNYQALFKKVYSWLKKDGLFFVHIFTHKDGAYHFEVKDETDWMSKYFFSGVMMPSDNLFYLFQDHLKIKNHWKVNGTHYQKTSRAWLDKMDSNKEAILKIFAKTYGADDAIKWFRYWRVFFIACEELWGYDKGNEWIVSHYLFSKGLN